MHHILKIAVMCVKLELSRQIGFLKVSELIIGKPEYKFNLKAIMVKEHGTYFFNIREVFSLDFVMSRLVSCQMHYKSDVYKA